MTKEELKRKYHGHTVTVSYPMGRRVFFVRGEGAFEITDKPKEEAHV